MKPTLLAPSLALTALGTLAQTALPTSSSQLAAPADDSL